MLTRDQRTQQLNIAGGFQIGEGSMRFSSFRTWGWFLFVASLRSAESSAQADPSDIYAVATLDENTTVVLDAQGRLLRSTDGRSFTEQSLTPGPFFGVSFLNSSLGMAV